MSRLDIVVFPADTTAPGVPTISSVTAVSDSRLDIEWSAVTDTGGSGLAGYKVYVATSSGGSYTLLETLSSASLSYSHTGLSAETQRWYKISAFDGAENESAQSAADSGTTLPSQGSGETFDADWTFRSTELEADVQRAVNFDSSSDVSTYMYGGMNPDNLQHVTTGQISGSGIMRLLHPASAGESAQNNWRIPFFSDEHSLPADVPVFVQFAVKYPPSRFQTNGSGDGWKSAILAGISSTCQGAELAHQNVNYRGFPQYYTTCGEHALYDEDFPDSGVFRHHNRVDHGSELADGDRYCLTHGGYGSGSAGCIDYTADVWWHWLHRVVRRSSGLADIDIWLHRRGTDSGWLPFASYQDFPFSATQSFAALWLLTYITNGATDTQDTHHDYDEVLVSNQMPSPPMSGLASSDLATAAEVLTAGDYINFAAGQETSFNEADLAWHSASYHDPMNGIVHLLGKPANSDTAWKHQYYSLATGAWTVTSPSWDGAGHIYDNATIDRETGDLYHSTGGGSRYFLKRFSADSRVWSELATSMYPDGGYFASHLNGVCWHPNLYGAGDGGIVVSTDARFCFWRKATDTWENVSHSVERLGTYTSCAQYFPAIDKVVIGGHSSADNVALVSPNGGSTPTIEYVNTPPIAAMGWSVPSGSTFGTTHVHPGDPTRLLLIERTNSGNNRVWETADGKAWALKAWTHPFPVGNWTLVALRPWGAFWMLGVIGGVRYSKLWKPDD